MGKTSIAWTDFSFNPWIGCTKVHAGCEHCYAEADQDKRRGRVKWGPSGTRSRTSDQNWKQPLKWNNAASGYADLYQIIKCRHDQGLTAFTSELAEEFKCSESLIAKRCCEMASLGILQAGKSILGCGWNISNPYHRPRVFCASLADVFEDWDGPIVDHNNKLLVTDNNSQVFHVETSWTPLGSERKMNMDDLRRDLFKLIDATPFLDWLVLTKRPENIRGMWPGLLEPAESGSPDWPGKLKYRKNVWLGTSVGDQETADKMIPELLKCRELAPVLFVSAEPLLGPIDFDLPRCEIHDREFVFHQDGIGDCCNECAADGYHSEMSYGHWIDGVPGQLIDWIIAGGESGPDARPCDVNWIRSIVQQGQAADVPVFVKQLGSNPVYFHDGGITGNENMATVPAKDKKGGNPSEWSHDLRVQQYPRGVD